jgi:hypothetical protein
MHQSLRACINRFTLATPFPVEVGIATAHMSDVSAAGAMVHLLPCHFRTVIRLTPSSRATNASGTPSEIALSAAILAAS